MTEEEVLALGVEQVEYVVDIEVGDSVKVLYGPLRILLVSLKKSTLIRKVKVLVSMFGRDFSRV